MFLDLFRRCRINFVFAREQNLRADYRLPSNSVDKSPLSLLQKVYHLFEDGLAKWNLTRQVGNHLPGRRCAFSWT